MARVGAWLLRCEDAWPQFKVRQLKRLQDVHSSATFVSHSVNALYVFLSLIDF